MWLSGRELACVRPCPGFYSSTTKKMPGKFFRRAPGYTKEKTQIEGRGGGGRSWRQLKKA
jgi:hypothetical protein